MLILPPGHAESIRPDRRLSVRDKRALATGAALIAALAVVLVIALVTAGPTSKHGCIYVTIAAATGAQQISQCGATARDTCRTALTPGAFATRQAADAVARECRKAGLPVIPMSK